MIAYNGHAPPSRIYIEAAFKPSGQLYLVSTDYKKQIQVDQISQLTGADITIQAAAELAAQEEITSYLTQKYDLSQEFKDTFAWDNSKVYNASDRVTDSGLIYYGAYPYPVFNYLGVYNTGDQVFWKNKTYTCVVASTILSHQSLIQQQSISSQNLNTDLGVNVVNVFPDDPINGVKYWGAGVAYSITAGTALTDSKWTKGDNRSQQMVMVMVDITLYHLHSRISPINIPDLRVKRYDEAIKWLKSAGKGDITANLPLKQVGSGARIRYGGNPKMINRW